MGGTENKHLLITKNNLEIARKILSMVMVGT